jgi:SMI1 / KNR4 family (SUKH-1)
MKSVMSFLFIAFALAVILLSVQNRSPKEGPMAQQLKPLPDQEKQFPGASEEEVAKFEEWLGAPLPPKYRNFLRTYNGGTFGDCKVIMSDIADGTIRPAPYEQYLQKLRTLALPAESTVSLYHDDGWLEIIREDDEILLMIGSMIDVGLLFVFVDTDRADQIWLKTPELPDRKGIEHPTEWFCLGRDIDEFLQRLHADE